MLRQGVSEDCVILLHHHMTIMRRGSIENSTLTTKWFNRTYISCKKKFCFLQFWKLVIFWNNRHLGHQLCSIYLTGVVAGVVRISIIFIIVPQIRTGEREGEGFFTTCRFIITIDCGSYCVGPTVKKLCGSVLVSEVFCGTPSPYN